MSEGAPSQRLPRWLSPRKLAYSNAAITGWIDKSDLQRLSDAVDSIGDVQISLEFSQNDDGKLVVSGAIEALLAYQCQRCLQIMPARSESVRLSVGIVRDEEEAKQLPRSLEPWIVLEDEADVYQLIEDELLLTMPVVAYHDFECIDASLLSSVAAADTDHKADKGPFSVLSELKSRED